MNIEVGDEVTNEGGEIYIVIRIKYSGVLLKSKDGKKQILIRDAYLKKHYKKKENESI